MLRLFGITDEQKEIELRGVLSLTINQEEDVPADDLSVTVVYQKLPKLYKITLTEDGETLFTGIVDEQQSVISNSSAYNRIVARSMAALLLDNEGAPASLNHPSTSVMFKLYVQPYGITEYIGKNIAVRERINIPKGWSAWQAVEAFSKAAFGASPRINQDGVICFDGVNNTEKIKFSNTGEINYNSLKENKLNCKLISNVKIKLKPDKGYELNLVNKNSDSQLIKRERYVDASVASSSVDVAQSMLDNSNRKLCEYELKSPQRLLNILGAKAVISDSVIGERQDLYVSSVYYRLTPNTELTTVKLKKET